MGYKKIPKEIIKPLVLALGSTIVVIGLSYMLAHQNTEPEMIQSFVITNDPYDPMPLRVGTAGAKFYHRPFCPYAKKSLALYGLEKRINYYTREKVTNSNRTADPYCMAGIFDCSNISPEEFATSGNDPWCGANIRLSNYVVKGIDESIAGKSLCKLDG